MPRAPETRDDTIMAVPKKKTSKAKSRSRRASAWTLSEPARSLCPQCRHTKVPHVVCGNCGWYAGRQAIEVD
ncbi:MAG: 50S ribosomal protein L32 [Acidimicrobiales bacterium]